jgi:hypothetical protein
MHGPYHRPLEPENITQDEIPNHTKAWSGSRYTQGLSQ